ncbi:hypothetical protein SPRG_05435 [Saprolegnia parasitica CBS 223.65]|uniref:Uncharacterized protein n=1 Tax=Saprolegnia parasitica (strain CBS 223.65) TaxID=695850 RepID=A0A067CFF7_SAPPC|nr:hypothetical protein SPRG_05435 [Saprolegnia parasitica CBS 223.65]KDO29193.1 hypothetical protein SPRG_05435 [Saprolegnia parasitica CBS 223.65]|eukprot:XP_012200070.1 hypothetical protein SPRG_05435 [Saprolegnia parasitica CBS 223.65]
MVQLTANVYDTVTRDELGRRHVIKVLLRLLSSNVMGICDVACTALGNCVAQSTSSSNQVEVPSPFVAVIDQLRGDRALKELLLSPRVAECGPGPTKHASRALVNMLFPNASIVCLDIDVWEGYIVAKQANERLDDTLAMPVHESWRISYRLGSGRQYMEGSMKLSTCMRHGAGVSSKGESFRVDGARHERNGVHNWTFETSFDNDGRPYGPLPISHMAFWSSQHADLMWGVWEVGASHQQHKLGTGGVFFMHATHAPSFY